MPTFKLRLPSNRTLGNICVYGAMVSISAVMFMRWKLEDRVRSSEYYKLALQTLRQHKGAVGLLGEPIKDSGFDISNSANTCNAESAQFEISVRGPKDKGKLFFWAINKEDGWLIDRLELEANQHPNKRFLLKKQDEYSVRDQTEPKHSELPAGVPHYERHGYPKPQPLHQAEESSAFVHTADGGRMR
ncbi:uncharacterized protein LOC6579736 [Drosophila mojavensis]|uniref:Cytochrome oxidase complex assembly protein 1 n=2 Tax=mojavensis species complex TaxID=198037 RepID=B4KT33_DROMO|nr:uncharacterized protein LOC6579736 [Drosophila mojavensis]XP_017867745.1 PREDICTED: uncharacterized protein LOC108616819 [Drosophila arizonae]EDW09553.1 uncharacterized protein Dmoj_GI20566 [Drosophila mojavensis]